MCLWRQWVIVGDVYQLFCITLCAFCLAFCQIIEGQHYLIVSRSNCKTILISRQVLVTVSVSFSQTTHLCCFTYKSSGHHPSIHFALCFVTYPILAYDTILLLSKAFHVALLIHAISLLFFSANLLHLTSCLETQKR